MVGAACLSSCSKVVEADEIDSINILQAALKAMEGAAAGLPTRPDFLLVDGNRLPKVRAGGLGACFGRRQALWLPEWLLGELV
jgi:ribonuclease HII